jgi:hypothetical protein
LPAEAAEPSVLECLNANNVSVKLRDERKLRAARDSLFVCARPSCPGEIRAECTRRLELLTASMPTVVFEVKDAAGHDVTQVRATMDGEQIASSLDGTALALDTGSHKFTFEASGFPSTSQTIVLRDGDKNRHISVVLAREPRGPAPPESADAGRSPRLLVLGLGGAGVVGVVLGSAFGIASFTTWSSANQECPAHDGCSSQATSDRSRAVTFSTVSDVGFIAGGAFLAGGLALYLLAPKDSSSKIGVVVTPTGARLGGSF